MEDDKADNYAWCFDGVPEENSLYLQYGPVRLEIPAMDLLLRPRRHWFTAKTEHHTNGGVQVLNLVQGDEAVVESPDGAFEPFVVHYAETFIMPACVGAYTISPYGKGNGQKLAAIKAFVR